MEDGPDYSSQSPAHREDVLRALAPSKAERRKAVSSRYSSFIRVLRVVFPLIALSLLVAVFAWNRSDVVSMEPAAPVEKSLRSVGKNELLKPHFESVDSQGRPFTVDAKRALQGQSVDDDVVLLEEPTADIALEDDHWLAVKAAQSAFRQSSERLLLKGQVEIFHDDGYTLYTDELDVDMKGGKARTDLDVRVQGPAGVLDAKGLEADQGLGLLVFQGPAHLELVGQEQSLGVIMP